MISVKENYIVNNKGKTMGVVLDKKDYDKILNYIEELEDVAAYDKEKSNKEAKTASWKSVKK